MVIAAGGQLHIERIRQPREGERERERDDASDAAHPYMGSFRDVQHTLLENCWAFFYELGMLKKRLITVFAEYCVLCTYKNNMLLHMSSCKRESKKGEKGVRLLNDF